MTCTTESNENSFEAHAIFEGYHYQGVVTISDTVVLVGFLMLRLKCGIILTAPHEVVTVDVTYPDVLLAYVCSFESFSPWRVVFKVVFENCSTNYVMFSKSRKMMGASLI